MNDISNFADSETVVIDGQAFGYAEVVDALCELCDETDNAIMSRAPAVEPAA